MSFRWTKLYRTYDVEKFTGVDNTISNHPQRYSFKKKDGTIIYTGNKEKFFHEGTTEFLRWHSDDMRAAFFFKTFDTLEEAKLYFSLEPHPIHKDKIIGTKFALHDKCTLKMTIEFKSKEEWKRFVDRNHDPLDPIAHGMKIYGPRVEYDIDYHGEKDPIL
jgi:hypothetical protein